MKWFFIVVFLLPLFLQAKEYPTFETGRFFNGLYYPRVDKIEWCDTAVYQRTCIELHAYTKHIPAMIDLGLAFNFDKSGPRPRLLINYIIKNRNETLCRFISAPEHFENGKYKVFVDRSNPDFDNFILTMDPEILKKEFERKKKTLEEVIPPAYTVCKEGEPSGNEAVAAPPSQSQKPAEQTVENTEQKKHRRKRHSGKRSHEGSTSEDGSIKSNVW